MGKVSYRFLICLFNTCLMLMLLINYVGWSGAFVNIATGNPHDWTNSYFGFQSLFGMLEGAETLLNLNPSLSPKAFVGVLEEFVRTASFNLPRLINLFVEKSGSALDIIWIVLTFVAQPVMIVAELVYLLVFVLWYALIFISVVISAFSGYYNIPFENMPDPDEFRNFIVTVPVLANGFCPLL